MAKKPPDSWDKQRYNRDYYQRHHGRVRALRRSTNATYRRRNRKLVAEYLAEHPCIDCGEKDVAVLEFDHVSGSKRMEVTTLARRGCSVKSLLAEIRKCEVRCANCHRRRTVSDREARRSAGADLQGKPKDWSRCPESNRGARFTNLPALARQLSFSDQD